MWKRKRKNWSCWSAWMRIEYMKPGMTMRKIAAAAGCSVSVVFGILHNQRYRSNYYAIKRKPPTVNHVIRPKKVKKVKNQDNSVNQRSYRSENQESNNDGDK